MIPELTWENFLGFHKKFYHPSNARVYFYGDDDVAARLEVSLFVLDSFKPFPKICTSSFEPFVCVVHSLVKWHWIWLIRTLVLAQGTLFRLGEVIPGLDCLLWYACAGRSYPDLTARIACLCCYIRH